MKYRIGQWVEHCGVEDYGVGKIMALDASGYYVQFACKYDWFSEHNLKPAPKTWYTLEVGDIIVDTDGATAKVFEVGVNTFLRSYWKDHDCAGSCCTFKQAKRYDWTIQGQDPSDDVTITVDGKEKVISRKSAEALGLVDKE